MTLMNQEPQRHQISIESDGETHKGTYWVAGKIITVTNSVGSKSHQVGRMTEKYQAEQMLIAIVKEGKVSTAGMSHPQV